MPDQRSFDDLGDGTTRVFHREELDLHPAAAWLLAPLLRDWLAADTPDEVSRMKQLLEEERSASLSML